MSEGWATDVRGRNDRCPGEKIPTQIADLTEVPVSQLSKISRYKTQQHEVWIVVAFFGSEP
jgi:hypothetical protein